MLSTAFGWGRLPISLNRSCRTRQQSFPGADLNQGISAKPPEHAPLPLRLVSSVEKADRVCFDAVAFAILIGNGAMAHARSLPDLLCLRPRLTVRLLT
ncbi:MAG: hypothetical protein WB676_21420 [Bryobacteraceae bacterium]